MLALLQMQMYQVPGWLQVAVAALAGLQSVAIIAGIFAAYYRFIREKPLATRLQPAISGVAARAGGGRSTCRSTCPPRTSAKSRYRSTVRRPGYGCRRAEPATGDRRFARCAAAIDRVWHETADAGEKAFRLELSVFENSGWLVVEVVNMVAEGIM